MRIEQLEYIAAVIEYGSLRRASERLHVSQPALSDAVSKLERELGVTLLERHRTGARISAAGRELMGSMVEVLEAVDRLRAAAGDQLSAGRTLRIGSVNAGTATLLLPAVHAFRDARPHASVEIRNLQQEEITVGLLEGSLDLGLVNLLSGDDLAQGLLGHELAIGRPVAVLPGGHPLASADDISVDDLREQPFVGMRSGYVMHRFAHRLFGPALPRDWHSTDGAEMGKLMVAEGLGITVLPDYSVIGDPMERAGLITARPIRDDETTIRMFVLWRHQDRVPESVRRLVAALREQAGSAGRQPDGPARGRAAS